MTALFQAVHIISLGTLHWHARLDPARWKRFTLPIPGTIHPTLVHLPLPRHPRLWTRRLITFPGGSLLPPSVASHASGTTGAGESSTFAPSLLYLSLGGRFHGFHFGGSPPLNHSTVLGGPLYNLNFTFTSYMCYHRERFFFWIFLSISFVSDHTPYSLRRTNASFVTRVNLSSAIHKLYMQTRSLNRVFTSLQEIETLETR
ncbi:hypothetical protein BGY98DRAFT_196102 [Russula aff. rugulosa BPL654]|nr:hypothetical protein BGY98DRAFT_196102 [Russula aff. rugulosa BPL654]